MYLTGFTQIQKEMFTFFVASQGLLCCKYFLTTHSSFIPSGTSVQHFRLLSDNLTVVTRSHTTQLLFTDST